MLLKEPALMRVPAGLVMLLFGVPAVCQERGLAPLVRGVFEDWVGSSSHGTFRFLTTDKETYGCAFTSRTYFEREHRRTFITNIEKGQQLEVLSERINEPPRCRALIVRVLTEKVLEGPRYRQRPIYSPTESFAPRGDLVYTGVVSRLNEKSFVLRTRDGARHLIQLRADTRFAGSGTPGDRALIPSNRPVQVRAGKTFENDIEAYSIVWGEMLQPVTR
jgi:hypothetical protein